MGIPFIIPEAVNKVIFSTYREFGMSMHNVYVVGCQMTVVLYDVFRCISMLKYIVL